MASLTYFKYTIEQKQDILGKYGRTVESIKDDIEAIKLWLEKQPHIPKHFGDDQIEHFLVANKFIFRNVKKTIDWHYRIRNVFPDFFRDPDDKSMVVILNQFYFFPLPKLTSLNCRVIFMKMRNATLDTNVDGCSYIAYGINMADLVINYDCPSAKIVVVDCKDIKLDFCSRFSPVILKTGLTIFERAYHNGVQGIHLLHLPSLLESFINLLKSIMNPKMIDRIHIHKNVNSVFEFISREILPIDYGGDEISFDELHELWKNELTKNLAFFKQRKDLVTDESLRTEEAMDCDLLGFQGNFRKLNLD